MDENETVDCILEDESTGLDLSHKENEDVGEASDKMLNPVADEQHNEPEAACDVTDKMDVSVDDEHPRNMDIPVADDKHTNQDSTYDYTRGELFTSEIYKIEIQNLPKHFGFKQLKKMILNLKLKPKKVKAVNRASYAFVTFMCEEDRQEALRVLNGHVWKHQVLKAKLAKPKDDPMTGKRKNQDQDQKLTKKMKEEEVQTREERLCGVITPLWNKPYEEQLMLKEKNMRQFMITLGRTYERQIPEVNSWLMTQRMKNNMLCCKLEPIKPAPVINEYRNKCEFTIGVSSEGQENTVGFRLGRYKGGIVDVMEPTCCCNVPSIMKKVAAAFQVHVRCSGLASHRPQTHQGHWQMLTVRTTLSNQLMVIAHLQRQRLTEEQVSEIKRKLVAFFVEGPGKSCSITSLYIQFQKDRERLPLEHLWGASYIQEQMMNLKFRISPEAFFQVNTKAAEVLYKTIADWCKVSHKTTVLDVCCGTGTIGISIAKNVHKVIGIEMNEQATHDARENARLNGIDNIEFHCGKAEDLMPKLTNGLKDCADIVAIVDPPRPGLHKKVIEALRRCAYLEKLLYVSCNPSNAISNFVDLCRRISIKSKGVPFRPVRAVPVDLFPHTLHCELLILFERKLSLDHEDKLPTENQQADTQIQNPPTSETSKATLEDVEGSEVDIEPNQATLTSVETSEATLEDVEGSEVDIDPNQATLTSVETSEATLEDVEGSEVDIEPNQATLTSVETSEATLEDVEGSEVDIEPNKATLTSVETSEATLEDVEGSEVDIDRNQATLTSVETSEATLEDVEGSKETSVNIELNKATFNQSENLLGNL